MVGGCGGPNCIYNDAWLLIFDLTLQTAWKWKQINVGFNYYYLETEEIKFLTSTQNKLLYHILLNALLLKYDPSAQIP